MMTKLEKLLDLCILLAERELGAKIVTETQPKPPKAPKAPKTEKTPEAPDPAAAAQPPVPPAAPAAMSEKESEDRLKVVGEAFVQRFSKQDDAVGEVKKIIEGQFKVARLRDLQHPQRVALIGILEGRIKEIDSKTTQSAAAPAGL